MIEYVHTQTMNMKYYHMFFLRPSLNGIHLSLIMTTWILQRIKLTFFQIKHLMNMVILVTFVNELMWITCRSFYVKIETSLKTTLTNVSCIATYFQNVWMLLTVMKLNSSRRHLILINSGLTLDVGWLTLDTIKNIRGNYSICSTTNYRLPTTDYRLLTTNRNSLKASF